MMQPAIEVFGAMVARLALRPPAIPFVSNLTGTWISAERAQDPHYWAAHLRAPVQFMAGAEALLASPALALVEVGPGATLGALVRAQAGFRAAHHLVVPSLLRAPDAAPDPVAVREAAARLWTAGVALDWPRLHRGRVQKVGPPGPPRQWPRQPSAAAPNRPPAMPALPAARRTSHRTAIPSAGSPRSGASSCGSSRHPPDPSQILP